MTSNALIIVVALIAAFSSIVFGHGHNKRGWPNCCGLPPFMDKLPADVKAQLETIWADYVNGQSCAVQQAQTMTLLKSLPESVRFGLRPTKGNPPCGVPPFVEQLPADMKQEMLVIWADYVPGEECQQQQKETRALLQALTEEERKALGPQDGRDGYRRGQRN